MCSPASLSKSLMSYYLILMSGINFDLVLHRVSVLCVGYCGGVIDAITPVSGSNFLFTGWFLRLSWPDRSPLILYQI